MSVRRPPPRARGPRRARRLSGWGASAPASTNNAATRAREQLSTKGSRFYTEVTFEDGDFLVFGPETRGLPDTIRAEIGQKGLLRIPMLPESRSLNLSNAAAILVYEAWRQLNFTAGI